MSAWRDSLGRIGGQAAPGVAGFWRWWTGALQAWLPPRWRQALGLERSRLLLLPRGQRLVVLRERGTLREPVAEVPWPLAPAALEAVLKAPLQRLPRHWLLAPGQVLRRRLRLPAQARARLRDVARFEIDRQTPFAAEQVYFDVRAQPGAEGASLEAELVVVPRARLEGAGGIDPAWRQGLSGIDVVDADGQPLQVNLLPPEQRRRQADPGRRLDLWLLLAGLVLTACAGGWLLDNRRAAVEALQSQVQARAARARAVAAQRQQLTDLVEGAAFLQRQRAGRPTATEVWNELSRRLPDGTYLEKFSMDGTQLQLIGLSTEASGLVRRLEGAPLWHTPALTGVLQGDAGGGDRFTLTAGLAVAPDKEAANGAGD